VIVGRLANGGLLMSATMQTFDVENPAHMAAAREIRRRSRPLTLSPGRTAPAPEPAGERSGAFPPVPDWPKARAMFQTAWKRFGIVLIDSPPILAASGAHLFAEIAESVLLAVCAGSADRNEVRKAKEQLDQTGTPALGAVLNQCNPKNHGRGRASRLMAIARRPKMSAGMEQVTKRKPEGESRAEVAIALTIVIPSYNTRELLSDCLGSIYQNPPNLMRSLSSMTPPRMERAR
jgi:hypothetical protein